MADVDYYAALGVSRQATPDEIKKAYRRMARELHPDANPDDPSAEARFKELARAYETLSDPDRRHRYDTYGSDEPGAGGGGGFGDIFDAFFGGGSPFGGGRRGPSGPPRGPDIEAVASLAFEDAVFGAQTPVTVRTAVTCTDCEGVGAVAGTTISTCPDCRGAGQVRQTRQSILGQMVTAAACQRCGATGQIIPSPCPACRGDGRIVEERTYTVDIPAGIDHGQTLRLTGRGAVGPRGGGPGDLFVRVKVAAHARFERHGADLVEQLHVPMVQAALGGTMALETLDSAEEVRLEPGTQTGRTVRFRGRGVPHVDGRGRGDLIVQVVVDTPAGLPPEQEELLRQLAALQGLDVSQRESGLFGKIRSAFS